MALKPPRLPLAGVRSFESALPAGAAALFGPDGTEPDMAHDEVENFSMATPRKAKADSSHASRHYIGSPRAEAILSAFLDFDDQDVTAAEGPPLDFDEAMAALEERAQPSSRGRTVGEEPEATKSRRGVNVGDECDSSGSTMCTDRSPGAACYNSDDSDEDEEEDSEEEREEDYESDFETDSGSEYETDEDDECIDVEAAATTEQAEATRQVSLADYGRDLPQIPPLRNKGSRAGSRANSRTGGRHGSRASSRTGGHRDRQSSRVRGERESSAAGQRDHAGVRSDSTTGRRKGRRNESRGAVQRLASLDRVLTQLTAAQPQQGS